MADVYFDNVATTPLDPRVLEAMMPFLEARFGNPSSLHRVGIEPRDAVEKARESVARMIGAHRREIVFTSGASEANNLAVKGVAWAAVGAAGEPADAEAVKTAGRAAESGAESAGRADGEIAARVDKRTAGATARSIVLSSIEHLSVLNAARRLQRSGFSLATIPVDGQGLVAPDDVARAITSDTVLVSVNLANPEVGTLEPLKEIAEVTRVRGVPLHCDATAAAGWIPIDVEDIGVDLMTLSAHNFYGPKGAGALFIRRGIRVVPLIDGGPHEGGLRAGTENVPALVGMGKAAEIAVSELPEVSRRLTPLRDMLVEELTRSLEGIVVTGHRSRRLPGHASFCVRGVEGEALLTDLDRRGISASSASACASVALKTSHVLEAMGVDTTLARGSLVFTLGRDADSDQVADVLTVLKASINRLRDLSP